MSLEEVDVSGMRLAFGRAGTGPLAVDGAWGSSERGVPAEVDTFIAGVSRWISGHYVATAGRGWRYTTGKRSERAEGHG